MTTIAFDYGTIKGAKRFDKTNPITLAFHNLKAGASAAGYKTCVLEEPTDHVFDYVVIFGEITQRKKDTDRAIRVQKHRDNGSRIISLDSGLFGTYIRDAFKTPETYMFRLGLDSCCGYGDFRVDNSTPDRYNSFKSHYNFSEKNPIIDFDKPILFLLQSERGWQYDETIPFYKWAREVVNEIREITDKQIVLRGHPNMDRNPIDLIANTHSNITLEQATRDRRGVIQSIQNSSAVVTHSSSAACEAYVEGVPIFALNSRCVVYDACENDLSLLTHLQDYNWSNRMQNLYNWAHMSIHVDEMRNPELIKKLLGE